MIHQRTHACSSHFAREQECLRLKEGFNRSFQIVLIVLQNGNANVIFSICDAFHTSNNTLF